MIKREYIKKYENDFFKITVEELDPFSFIATFWDKDMELEVDRRVSEFETFGGAVSQAFEYLSEVVEKSK